MNRKLRNILFVLLTFVICVSLAACAAIDDSLYQAEIKKDVYGIVEGLQDEDYNEALVVLYDTTNAYTSVIDENLQYAFDDIKEGSYFIRIEVDGYQIPKPVEVTIEEGKYLNKNLSVAKVESSDYYFQWKADDTYFGYEESASVPEKKTVTFIDEQVYVGDSSATAKLLSGYKIILSNEDMKWSSDYSAKMYTLVSGIHNFPRELPSKWVLTAEEIDDDIEIQYKTNGAVVKINKNAFENATPRKATMNGLRGTYFSNRLYHALIRYATKEGTDIYYIDELLKEKYGCSIIVEDYEALTRGITNETAAAFEQFKPEELLAILEMFAEMPEGFHKIENLEYLVRRIDGSKNLIYPDAAAVSWIYAEHGYIEFIDVAFLGAEVEDTFRLVLHEKTHFLWAHVFSEDLKREWAEIGGWYQTDKDSDGWATSKETEFVTAYAHAHNPDEDMAESVAYYILMPDKLESRSPAKYAFIRDYIMNGEIYMAQIREDLTFEVYNLYPDYAYPGRIVSVDIKVEGAPNEDKQVTVTLTLDTHGDPKYGAAYGITRISNETLTYYDMWFAPVNGDNSVLQGTVTFSKYAYDGFWYAEQISLSDANGNERFVGSDNFGWKLYIENPLYDSELPEYVKDSMYVVMEPGTLDGHDITYVHVKFKATDNIGIKATYCEIANNTTNGYRMDQWGSYDETTGEGTVTYIFTEFTQSGEYSVNYLNLLDFGENTSRYNFFSDGTGAGKAVTFNYYSPNSDYEAPEVNLNNIILNAYPTHPDKPNGETLVVIDYFVRDNASGFGLCSFQLLDPMGNTHHEYHYHENFYTNFFEGDPTVWTAYRISIILPEGSAPGKWGLLELYVCDKAGNFRHYNFLEIVHFVIDEHQGDPTFEVVAESDQLVVGKNMQLTATGLEEGKDYLWECTNRSGKGNVTPEGVFTAIQSGYVTVTVYERYDKTKFGQIDILIVSDAHNMGEWKLEIDPTKQNCGLAIRHCKDNGCDYFETMTLDILLFLLGDVDENDAIDLDDALHLMKAIDDGQYEVLNQSCDFNGDGRVNEQDAAYLMMYCYFPEQYPLLYRIS